jgi:uncharacterized membrane protein YjjP (DUF1212 family)
MKERTGMQAVEVALDAAMQVMQNGGSTIAADRTFSNVLNGFKKEGILAVWRLDFIALSAGALADSSAVIRPVGPIGSNLARASQVMHLAERLVGGSISTSEFSAELERTKKLGSPYNRWLMIAAAACVSGFLSRIAGGDWGSFGIAVLAAAVGQFLRSLLPAGKLTVATMILICGVLSSLIGSVGLRLGWSATEPATLIASVFYMVPGLPLINGFIDMTSQKYLIVGMQRMLSAAFVFLILAIAIAFAITLVL